MGKTTTAKVTRDSSTGRFVPADTAKKHPRTTETETVTRKTPKK